MASALDDDRTVDVLVFHDRNQDTQLLLQLTGDDELAVVVSGIRRMSQTWVLLFLKTTGSTMFAANEGTRFIEEIRGGSVRTVDDLVGAFYRAELRVRRQMKASEITADPDDERLESAKLLDAAVLGDQVTITVRLRSRAGETREVLVPVQLAI